MLTNINSLFFVQIISTRNVIRSKNLELKLSELELQFQVSPGVLPSKNDFNSGLLHSAFLSRLTCQRNLRIGEVGCALAHRNALTNFVNSDKEFGLIFEDDAEIIADFNFEVISNVLDSALPIIIALGWIPGFAIARTPTLVLNEKPIELITSPTCAFAYALNHSAAKLMLSGSKKIIDIADWPIHALNKMSFYSTSSPWVTADQDPALSTIGVRTLPMSTGPVRVLIKRIELVSSLLTLIILSMANKLDVSIKQIMHRLLIRDMLYKYGKSQVAENSTTNEVIPFPLKFHRLLKLLKIN